jgi:hypothetical protein
MQPGKLGDCPSPDASIPGPTVSEFTVSHLQRQYEFAVPQNGNGHSDMSYGRWRGLRRSRADAADIPVCIALVLAAVAALLSTLHAQAVPWEQMRSLTVAGVASEMAVMAEAIAEHPATEPPP